tara:strand:+ start:387 stop:590 length:204 start_codon:yes stop_codon:yes gene_type:complete
VEEVLRVLIRSIVNQVKMLVLVRVILDFMLKDKPDALILVLTVIRFILKKQANALKVVCTDPMNKDV